MSPSGVADRLVTIKAEAEAVGRDGIPSVIQVRLDLDRVTPEVTADYAAAGVDELVVSCTTGDVDVIRQKLEAFATTHIEGRG